MIHISHIRQALLMFLIAVLFGLIFWNLKLFAPAFLAAYTLYILLRKPCEYLTHTRNWPQKLSTGFMMLVSFLIILVPMYGFIRVLSVKIKDGFQNKEAIIIPLEITLLKFEKYTNLELRTPERVQVLSEWGVQQASQVVNATLLIFVMLLITYCILWFMLSASAAMERFLFGWLPFQPANTIELRKELDNLVMANAVGIPLMGTVQGIVGVIGYAIVGVEDLWFWFFMTFVAGMIPFLGVSLAVIPLTMVLLSKGLIREASFVLIYGFVVVGSVDNLARMWLMNRMGHTHPLITLFGVIIGLQLLGFIGFIFGPIIISMFLLLVKMYAKEFKKPTDPLSN